jgi:tRNA (guanine26-N2/guanine27-N2)-dimethyltransferase
MSKLLSFSMREIKEGSAEVFIPKEEKISKKLPVFYNPIMRLNRDITILLLQQFPPMNLCDPLAASGIRAIRFAKELKYKSIIANDLNEKAATLISKNMRYNKVKFEIKNEDINIMLLESNGFDFMDLDVFGSSNYCLDPAVKRISRKGILAVTNTDTAALTGTYPKVCVRKYWSSNKKNYLMHETGLRILIRKVQLIGIQYEKALVPIFSYFKDHYFRIFFKCVKGKKEADKIALQHGVFNGSGPMWLGSLFDSKLVGKMYSAILKSNNKKTNNTKNLMNKNNNQNDSKLLKFLKIIKEESKINVVGFFDTHESGSKEIMKKEELIKKIRKKGYKAASTHFSGTGVRTDIDYKRIS